MRDLLHPPSRWREQNIGDISQSNSIHDNLAFIIENFAKVKEGNKIKGAPKPEALVALSDQVFSSMKSFTRELNRKLSDRYGEEIDLDVNYGRGQGNWPEVAWIYLGLNGEFDWMGKRLQLPINVQFDDKAGGVFLTLLGVGKELKDTFGDAWLKRVEEIRAAIKGQVDELDMDLSGFKFDPPDATYLRKGSDSQVMRLTYFMYKFYPATSIPGDEQIVTDISALLGVQDHLYDMGGDARYWAVLPSDDKGAKEREIDLGLQLLLKKGQVILYGPPGTGKTYQTRGLALSIIRGE